MEKSSIKNVLFNDPRQCLSGLNSIISTSLHLREHSSSPQQAFVNRRPSSGPNEACKGFFTARVLHHKGSEISCFVYCNQTARWGSGHMAPGTRVSSQQPLKRVVLRAGLKYCGQTEPCLPGINVSINGWSTSTYPVLIIRISLNTFPSQLLGSYWILTF